VTDLYVTLQKGFKRYGFKFFISPSLFLSTLSSQWLELNKPREDDVSIVELLKMNVEGNALVIRGRLS
jgi:hypothetical protein